MSNTVGSWFFCSTVRADRRGDQEASQGIEVALGGGRLARSGKTPRVVMPYIRYPKHFNLLRVLSSCFSGPGRLKIVAKEET